MTIWEEFQVETETLLTVAIPTFNRVEAVVERVRELTELSSVFNFHVLISDNCSTDGTAKRLADEVRGTGFTLLVNEENVGYGRNLLSVVNAAQTPYIMVVSDEDRVEPDGLTSLLSFLESERPRLVSPRAHVRGDDAYRGRHESRQMSAREFEDASFYLSGLTFEVERTRRDIPLVEALITENRAALYYPQVLLTALALLDGNCHFLDARVTRQVVELGTEITGGGRDAYWHVPSRWLQFEGYEDFFEGLERDHPGKRALVHEMRDVMRDSIFARLEMAALAEYPFLKRPIIKPSLLRRIAGRVLRRLRAGRQAPTSSGSAA